MTEIVETNAPSTPIPPRRWDWRPKLRWFAAEILIVVAGVLIALALNAWWQGRQDAASEQSYLALISRDLEQMAENLQELADYEDGQFQHSLTAYRILSMSAPTEAEQDTASESLERLTSRRTIHATRATYEDLLNTGNIQLIRDRTLRRRLVSFYEEAERNFDIHNKNNAVFVDELYAHEVFRNGLIYTHARFGLARWARVDSLFNARIAGGYVDDPDPLWSLPQGAPQWNTVRAILLQRMRVAAYAHAFARTQLDETRELQRAIEAELNR